jgi:hypothetical protein
MSIDCTADQRVLLRESIEALALDVALRDLSSPAQMQQLAPLLTQIRRHAESAGMTAVAEVACIEAVTETAWRDMVSRMQSLMAEPESPVASVRPAALALN